MARKIRINRNQFDSKPLRQTNNCFALIALSSSVLAFFLGIGLGFLEPTGVHSQTTGENRGASPSDPQQTLHLKREFIYLGSRLIAIDEAGSPFTVPDEPMTWSPRSGLWRGLRDSELSPSFIRFGGIDDEPFLSDFDGDGLMDQILLDRKNANWTIRNSFSGTLSEFRFGQPTDVFSLADLDGDGRADITAFDVTSGRWTIRYSTGPRFDQVDFGKSDDLPCIGDFDGDGRADVAVWRDSTSTLHLRRSSDGGFEEISMNGRQGQALCSDFDGDGRADVLLKTEKDWLIRLTGSGVFEVIDMKGATGLPVVADFDGDGRKDISLWNTETAIWTVFESGSGNLRSFRHGNKGDKPLAGFFRR